MFQLDNLAGPSTALRGKAALYVNVEQTRHAGESLRPPLSLHSSDTRTVHAGDPSHSSDTRCFVTLVSSPSQVSLHLQTQFRHTCFVPRPSFIQFANANSSHLLRPKPSSIVPDNAVSSPLFRPQAKLHCTCKRGFVTLVSSPSRVSLQLQKRFRRICFVPELSFIALASAVSSHSFHPPPSPIALANAGSSHFRVHGRVCCCGFHVLLRIMEDFYGLGRSLGRLLGRSLGRSFGFVA